MTTVHPDAALFAGEKPFPVIAACEHFAGSEKLILKALEQMEKLGPVFNITCDCEDGAPAGSEREHAGMIARVLQTEANHHHMAGARIHDFSHPAWRMWKFWSVAPAICSPI
jgi:citrate lyase subunit beta/citryl-CoA lyase